MLKRTTQILDWYMRNARKATIAQAVAHEREECAITLIDISMLHPDKQCRDALLIAAYEIVERGANGR